jgi:hypothetical protein
MLAYIMERHGLLTSAYTVKNKYEYDMSVVSYTSSDMKHRYMLSVMWGIPNGGTLTVVGKNPSTAGIIKHTDNTFTRIIKIAIANGYSSVIFLNLSSKAETKFTDGNENILHTIINKYVITTILRQGLNVYCYWGRLTKFPSLKKKMLSYVKYEFHNNNLNLFCWTTNEDNSPKHIARGDYGNGIMAAFNPV